MQSIIKIHALDNVAVALRDVAQGEAVTAGGVTVTLPQPVARGHKFALYDIAPGEMIVKYGLPIGHALVAIAFLVGITVFFHRDDRKFKLQLSLYSVIIGIHFFLMGANAAGASALLNAGRTVIATRTHNLVVMFAFIILTLVLGLSGLKHAVELLPIIGALISTSGLTTRCVIWCATLCWVIHNVWLGSIGGSLIEGTFLILNGYNIIRFRRMQKRGLDPFRAETQSR
ncbi:hypothetical protein CS369_07350 [Candidatus Symbiopectobacterium sp. 'North America']|uniref:YgjV family protein n=1 Tax=Candidatus Symbiopectobacterium sp. 'North America' TaxID=2794574 RepID=UPI0018CA39FC|nr:YgjV family protein [Candidatus Symbiopectobacterium sp. 'North America']MBG6244632.1 hypothetical protein [Candidatus Symbiopectobacterium sp. 'North America']